MNQIDSRPFSRSDVQAKIDDPFQFDDGETAFDDDGNSASVFADTWAAARRNKWLIGTVVTAAILIGIAITLLTAPTFTARATVQVDQRTARVLGTEEQETALSAADSERFLQTQVDILKSKSLAERVARRLKLTNDARFATAMGLSQTKSQSEAAIVRALQDGLGVTLPRNSRVIGVLFASRNADVSADVTNAFINSFVESNLQRKVDQSAYAQDFLRKELAEARARLEQSELELIGYARSAHLIDASAGTGADASNAAPRSLITASLVQANEVYSSARSTRLQTESKWQEIRARPIMSLPEVLSNPAIQELTQRRAELQADYQLDRQKHKEEYPTVIQKAAAIRELDSQIGLIASSIKQSIENAFLIARAQEDAAQRNLGALRSDTLDEQDRSVQYNVRKRETDTNRQLYDALLQRYKEVSAEAGATNNNIAIIDRADPPSQPTSPKPLQNLALAILAGLILAFFAVFVRERFDDSIRIPDEVERKLNLPLLAAIPLAKGYDSPLEALDMPRSALAEAFQTLRTAVELTAASGDQGRTILLTSSRQGEGKSTTAIGIARALATKDLPVVLLDVDLRKPSLHRNFDCENAAGLSNALSGLSDIASVIQHTGIDGLDLIPSGPLPPNPAQLLTEGALLTVIDKLTSTYRYVILDAPPVMGLADAPRLASIADITIFVVEANSAHRGAAKAALRRLQAVHANLVGAVLTKFDAQRSGYGRDQDYYAYNYSD